MIARAATRSVPSPVYGGGIGRGHTTRFSRARSPLPHPSPQGGFAQESPAAHKIGRLPIKAKPYQVVGFVDDRAEARVYIRREGGPADARESGADIAAVGAEVFRALRRQSVAQVPLKTEHLTGIVLSSSFLVEKELWNDFTGSVEEQRTKYPGLHFDLSGPWPPP